MRSKICEIGKKLYDKGHAAGTAGNISHKEGDVIYLTASGICLGELTPYDIVVIDLNGNILEGGKKPTSEMYMHIEIYKKRPDITAIIHAHPPKSTAVGVLGKDLTRPIIAEAVVILGDVPLIKYDTPSTHELAELVAEGFINHDAVLMANHGATVVGRDINEAYHKLETLEFVSEMTLITESIGKCNEIPKSKLPELLKLKK